MDNEDTVLHNFQTSLLLLVAAVQRGSQKSLMVDEGSGYSGYGVFSLHTDKTAFLFY